MSLQHRISITHDSTRLEELPAGVSAWEYRVAKGVKFTLVITSTKRRNSDARITVKLAGKGAFAVITGVLFAGGNAKVALHTMQIHQAPDTTSDLLIKTILSDHARCLYDGGIRVEKAAQKTDAYQRNENLLLSGRAYAESKPSLEILANDVRCTHGATTGPIDSDELWYLSTRGISAAAGERLIVKGFVTQAFSRIEDEKVRGELTKQFSGV